MRKPGTKYFSPEASSENYYIKGHQSAKIYENHFRLWKFPGIILNSIEFDFHRSRNKIFTKFCTFQVQLYKNQ